MNRYGFTPALLRNIEKTFSYAYAKNTGRYTNAPDSYDAVNFFNKQLTLSNPFKLFMELDRYGFLNAKKAVQKYKIPFTSSQERAARVFYDVTTRMEKERSDYVSMYVEDLEGTGVVKYAEPYVLTTEDTLYVAEQINHLPRHKEAFNVLYKDYIPKSLKASNEQMNAVETCLKSHISCLIGGAGTGKSFVTAAIIKQLQLNGHDVAVLAPTHKAREALQAKLTECDATVKTVHGFVHSPVECDAIVIDESGMLSTVLMAKLLRIYEGQQLIFVGDKNQLEPVGYGRPFERIQLLFTTATLKENHRSESADIIALGREVLGIPQNANMAMPNIEVVGTVDQAFQHGAEVALSYTNSNVKSINESQKVKNGISSISPFFSVGDVIVAKTNERGRFYNGQIFKIIGYNQIQKKDNNRIITLKSDKDLQNNFDLAYGLTIHKSQGSEWDVVAYQPSASDYQNLAYVAITRARKRLIIIGDGIKTEYKPNREWRHIG